MKKEKLGLDFISKIDNEWLNDRAESHIEAWKERYNNYKTKKELRFDLNVNHDPSLEVENAEELLTRKLTSFEYDTLVNMFNKKVYKIFVIKKYWVS